MVNREQSKEQYNALLEEYKSLRTEIMNRQDARLYIAGFTMAAIGTVLGLTLREGASVGHELNYYIVALMGFALIVLNAALILTIQYTQQIATISIYIEKFIESKISWMGWETRWTLYRKLKREKEPTFLGFPWSTSRSLALFYAFLTAAVYSVIYAISFSSPYVLILISVLAISSFTISYDLFNKKSKGWNISSYWDMIDKQH